MGSRRTLLFIGLVLLASAIAVSFINMRHDRLLVKRNVVESEQDINATPEPDSMSFTLTAVGDCTLATDVTTPQEGSFESMVEQLGGDYGYFFRNVADIFAADDLTMVNFEGTLSNRGERQEKTFAFRGSPDYVNILTSSSVEAASLANNHSSDYGKVSLTDTAAALTNAGILAFNGTSIATTMINGVKIALVGINALNSDDAAMLEECVRRAKINGAQIVILYVHWGEEKEIEPNEEQTELAHAAIDAGADLVLGSHPHVLQGVEKYKGRYIVYSLGNFCFGGNTDPADKDTVIVRATISVDESGTYVDNDGISFIPCKISSTDEYNNYQPTPAEGEERDRIIEKINERTSMIAPLNLKFE